jgi:hypothetical protein
MQVRCLKSVDRYRATGADERSGPAAESFPHASASRSMGSHMPQRHGRQPLRSIALARRASRRASPAADVAPSASILIVEP